MAAPVFGDKVGAMNRTTLLIDSLGGGGAEGVCVTIANGLAERGWRVDLLVLSLNEAKYLDRVHGGVNLINLQQNRPRASSLKIFRFILRARPKEIIVFSPDLAVILIMLKFLFRFQTKIIVRNINTMSRILDEKKGFYQSVIVKSLFNVFFSKADHIINQCKAMEADFVTTYPRAATKTSVIYNPVNPHLEMIAKENQVVPEASEPYLLCIGRLVEQKSFHLAIEAFKIIAELYPSLRLKILVQGPLERALRAKAEHLSLGRRVDFEGFQKETTRFYLGAKATVLTSIYEGFPNVLIESITLGTPVVAFDCPSGPCEIIEEGVNGFLIEPQSVEALAIAFKKVLRGRLSESRIKETAKRFSSQKIIDDYAGAVTLHK